MKAAQSFHIREDTRHAIYTDKMEFHILGLSQLLKELRKDSNDIGHILCDINMECYQKRHEDFEGAIDATKLFTDELKLYR